MRSNVLKKKTDIRIVQQQASWAGIKPGMRIADIGCGSGITTQALFQMVQPGGQAVGVDMSEVPASRMQSKNMAAHNCIFNVAMCWSP
jgi:ubiquinone/menaquinone biosynthesis C-methylase UbiE